MRYLFLALALSAPVMAQAGNVDAPAAQQTLAGGKALLIDVRTPAEFASGAIQGALLIPQQELVERIAAIAPDKGTPIVLYCRSGNRSGQAQDALKEMGYTQVINGGGYQQLQGQLTQAKVD